MLNERQLRRHLKASTRELSCIPSVMRTVRPSHTDPSLEVTVTFHALSQATLARLGDAQLCHLAGAAQARLHLGASPGEWTSSAHEAHGAEYPDALWQTPDGRRIAVEYDSGAYTRATVDRKHEAYAQSDYDEVLWVVVSGLRYDRLRLRPVDARRMHTGNRRLDVKVLLLRWWE